MIHTYGIPWEKCQIASARSTQLQGLNVKPQLGHVSERIKKYERSVEPMPCAYNENLLSAVVFNGIC